MSGAIIRVEKNGKVAYMEWTTIGGGPGMGMMLGAFKAYYKDRYGTSGLEQLQERLDRADETGSSSFADTLEDLMKYNYQDENGEQREISFDELWERYVEGVVCSRCHHATRVEEMDGDVCRRQKCQDGTYHWLQGESS